MAVLSEILLIKRVDGFFYVNGYKIKAGRVSSPGYSVLVVFEPSKLDYDFKAVLCRNRFAWFPSAESLRLIEQQLDLSDHMTSDCCTMPKARMLVHDRLSWRSSYE